MERDDRQRAHARTNRLAFPHDPSEVGDEEQWFTAAHSTEAEWTPIKVPAYWDESETIGEMLGNGWYRVAFALPPDWKGKGLRLMFAGVDEQAWIYLNDKLIGEHSRDPKRRPSPPSMMNPSSSKCRPSNSCPAARISFACECTTSAEQAASGVRFR